MKKRVEIVINQSRSVTTFFNRVLENFERKFDGFPAILLGGSSTPAIQEESIDYTDFLDPNIIDEIANSFVDQAKPPCPDIPRETCFDADPDGDYCANISALTFDFLDLPTSWIVSNRISSGLVYNNPVSGFINAQYEWLWNSPPSGSGLPSSAGEDVESRYYMSYKTDSFFPSSVPSGTPARTVGLHCKLGRSPSSVSCATTWELYAGNWGTSQPAWDNLGTPVASGFIPAGVTEVEIDAHWVPEHPLYIQYVFVNTSDTGEGGPFPAQTCAERGTPSQAEGDFPYNRFFIVRSTGNEYSLCATLPGNGNCSGETTVGDLERFGAVYSADLDVEYFSNVWFDDVEAIRDVDFTASDNTITPIAPLDEDVIVKARYLVR